MVPADTRGYRSDHSDPRKIHHEPPESGGPERPSVLVFGRDGSLRQVGCAADLTPAACRVVRSLAATAQLTLRDGASWRVTEDDATGRYGATYARVGDGLVREKDAYEVLATAGAIEPVGAHAGTVVTGSTTFALHRTGHPESIDSVQHLAVASEARTVHAEETCHLELRSATLGAAPALPATEAWGPVLRPLDLDRGVADRAIVADHTPTDLLRELAAADPGAAGDGQRISLARRAAAMIRLDPSLAAVFAHHLLGARPTPGNELLVAGIGNAGTPAAAAALRTLFADPDFAVVAMAAAATSSYADQATVDALAAAALAHTDEGYTAARAVGAVAAHAGTEVDVLLDLVVSEDPEARLAAIDGLGSAGDHRGLPYVLAALDDPATAASATYALRNMPGGAVDEALVRMLYSPDPAVARAAADAIPYRDPADWRPVLEQVFAAGVLGDGLVASLQEFARGA